MVYQVYHLSILNAHLGEIICSDSFNELKPFLKNWRNQGEAEAGNISFSDVDVDSGQAAGWVLTPMVQNFMSPKCLYEGHVQFYTQN